MLATLLPPVVAVVVAAPADAEQPLLGDELHFVRNATDARRREFAAGRACARSALRRLGATEVAIPASDQRAPQWPAGVVGSITHCAGFTAAAVALRRDVAMLGIDAEPTGRLDDDVAEHVASRKERERAGDELGEDAAPVIFSAKESIYKAWYPATGRWLDFDAVTVLVDRSGVFSIEPCADLAADDRALLSGLHGRFAVTARHILTAVYGWGVPSGGGRDD